MHNQFDDLSAALCEAVVAMRTRAATMRSVARKCADSFPQDAYLDKADELDHLAEVIAAFNLDLNAHWSPDAALADVAPNGAATARPGAAG